VATRSGGAGGGGEGEGGSREGPPTVKLEQRLIVDQDLPGQRRAVVTYRTLGHQGTTRPHLRIDADGIAVGRWAAAAAATAAPAPTFGGWQGLRAGAPTNAPAVAAAPVPACIAA
jgi:hypothetical protein